MAKQIKTIFSTPLGLLLVVAAFIAEVMIVKPYERLFWRQQKQFRLYLADEIQKWVMMIWTGVYIVIVI